MFQNTKQQELMSLPAGLQAMSTQVDGKKMKFILNMNI
jgi:hypothetical protein